MPVGARVLLSGVGELSLVLLVFAALHRPALAWELLRLYPERSRTTSFDTLVARAAPCGASRAEDHFGSPRVNATSFCDPRCLRLRAVIEGATIAVSRDRLSRGRFHGHDPRSPATSSRLCRRASASALSFCALAPGFHQDRRAAPAIVCPIEGFHPAVPAR